MSSSGCWKYLNSRFRCALDLNWCFRSWRVAVFKAHEHKLGCSRCFQHRIWKQASDWLNSFVAGSKLLIGWTLLWTAVNKHKKGYISSASLRTAYRIHPRSLCTSACEIYNYDTVLIENFQVNPKPFVCWTAIFKRDLCGRRAKLRDWKMMTEFVLDLASCLTGRTALSMHSAGQPADERDTAVQRLNTRHFYCPLVTLKGKSDDLLFAWSGKLHDRPRSAGRAQCGAASWWEGYSRFEGWTQHTFIAPPPPSGHLVTVSLWAKKADLPTW